MTRWEHQGLQLCLEYQQGMRLSKSYIDHTRRALLLFYRYLRAKRLDPTTHLTTQTIAAYQTWLLGRRREGEAGKLASATIRGYMQAVKLLCQRLYRAGFLLHDPSQNLELLPVRHQARMVPTRQGMSDLLEAMDTKTQLGVRNRAMFELMYSSGLRSGEVAGLEFADLDVAARTIRVQGKGNKERLVPVSEVALAFILHYGGSKRPRTGPIFKSRKNPTKAISVQVVARVFREELARQGKQDSGLVPHSIRHATATHLLENGAGIRYVGELLGHESLQTTVNYTLKLYESIGAMYRRHHPRGLVGKGRCGSPEYIALIVQALTPEA